MKALLDTNILIDFLNGIEAARLEIKRYESPLSARSPGWKLWWGK